MNSCRQIKSLTAVDFALWDDYVRSHKQGSFFHLSGWQTVIEQSFSHTCYFIYAECDNAIVGVLPLVEVKSRLFGHALISTPFCVYGGVLSDSEEISRELEQYACRLAKRLKVDYLELRYKEAQNSPLLVKKVSSTFGCELAEDNEQILATGFSCRSQVKRLTELKAIHPVEALLMAIPT